MLETVLSHLKNYITEQWKILTPNTISKQEKIEFLLICYLPKANSVCLFISLSLPVCYSIYQSIYRSSFSGCLITHSWLDENRHNFRSNYFSRCGLFSCSNTGFTNLAFQLLSQCYISSLTKTLKLAFETHAYSYWQLKTSHLSVPCLLTVVASNL